MTQEQKKFIEKIETIIDNWISKPCKCPVCNGKGLVPYWFYLARGMNTTTSSISDIQCKPCNGTGIIYPQPPKQPTKKRGGCNP